MIAYKLLKQRKNGTLGPLGERTMVYNGWTNYETWTVNLWMDNEQEYWSEHARKTLKSATCKDVAIQSLADSMQGEHEAEPAIDGVYADLLNAALGEVNWREIASHWLDEAID